MPPDCENLSAIGDFMRSIRVLSKKAQALLTLTAMISLGQGPAAAANRAPVVASLSDMTVYVKEPVRFGIKVSDPENNPLAYGLSGLPAGATIGASTGRFAWNPTLADTGVHSAAFTVSDGTTLISRSIAITVVMPKLAQTEWTRVLRPNGGEIYRYGDTITIAFVTLSSSMEAQVIIQIGKSYLKRLIYTPQYEDRLNLDGDTLDARGIPCRYLFSIPEQEVNVGFYRLVLRDTTVASFIDFGGNTKAADSLKILINDPYGEDGTTKTGDYSDAFFTVAPAANAVTHFRFPVRLDPTPGIVRPRSTNAGFYSVAGARIGNQLFASAKKNSLKGRMVIGSAGHEATKSISFR